MAWRTFWGFVLVVIGITFLLVNLGILPGGVWGYIFPAFLVILGVAMLAGLRGGRHPETVHDSAPLNGATQAVVGLKHGAGRLAVHAENDPALLFSGTFVGGVDKKVSLNDGTASLELKTPTDVWANVPFPGTYGLSWDLGLASTIPLALKYEGGAAETQMDLGSLKLSSLELHTGASSTDVVLPPPTGTLHVEVHSGAASVKLRLPSNIPASIRGTMGLGSLDVDRQRFPDRGAGLYQSDGFADAADRVEVHVEGGVGSVQIS